MSIRDDQIGVTDRSRSRLARAARYVQQHGLNRVVDLVRKHGWAGVRDFMYRNVRYLIADWHARVYDAIHHLDTAGEIPAEYMATVGESQQYGHQFISTSPRSFRQFMKLLPHPAGYAFVDIGSGKGRMLFLAAQYPFKEVIGVEYAPDLVKISDNNIHNFRGRTNCSNISSICADATQYTLPDAPLMIYLFNPFDIEIFEKVMANIAASHASNPRPMFIVYVSPKIEMLPKVEAVVLRYPSFGLQDRATAKFYLDTPWRLHCSVFKAG
jgi:SAM-dependent methyltransferase